jgi:hypothetical protein
MLAPGDLDAMVNRGASRESDPYTATDKLVQRVFRA